MTVIRPNSVAGINSITVQSGNSLSVHKANGELIRTLTSSSGVSTFSTLSVGTATTDNSAAKSINIGLGASISQHDDNTLTFGTAGDPVAKFDASGHFLPNTDSQFNIGSNSVRFANGYFDTLYGDGSNLTGLSANSISQGNSTAEILDTGTNGIFRFIPESSEVFRITHEAKVGINTNNPSHNLDISGDGVAFPSAAGSTVLRLRNSGGSTTLSIDSNAGNAGAIQFGDTSASSQGSILYHHATNHLQFNTNGTERLRIGGSGGVGISTDKIRNADFLHIATLSQDFTNPTEELMDGGGICFQTIDNLAATGRSFPGIFWSSNTAALGRARAGIIGVAANNNDATDIVFLGKYLPGGDGMYPRDERMRIRAQSGYVGINTATPDRQLHIVGGDGPTQATCGNSDTIFVLDNKGTNGAIVEFKGDTNGAGRIMFTDTDASNQGQIEYLHSSDTLQFTSNGGNPGYELQSDSKSRFNVVNSKVLIDKNNTGTIVDFDKSGTSVGTISITSSNTSYNTSSDYRLKENVVGITSAITRLKTLKPSRFNFKIDPSVTIDGFLAHEVTAVPEATTGTKDQVATADDVTSGIATAVGDPIYQGIDQSKLVPLLTAALQEAITKIETLETKVAALEGG